MPEYRFIDNDVFTVSNSNRFFNTLPQPGNLATGPSNGFVTVTQGSVAINSRDWSWGSPIDAVPESPEVVFGLHIASIHSQIADMLCKISGLTPAMLRPDASLSEHAQMLEDYFEKYEEERRADARQRQQIHHP